MRPREPVCEPRLAPQIGLPDRADHLLVSHEKVA